MLLSTTNLYIFCALCVNHGRVEEANLTQNNKIILFSRRCLPACLPKEQDVSSKMEKSIRNNFISNETKLIRQQRKNASR